MARKSSRYNLSLLDYRKIIDIIGKFCISDYARERLWKIRPKDKEQDLQNAFNELKELITVTENRVYPNIHRIHDTRVSVDRAQIKNNCLPVEELVSIRENIESFISIKRDISPLFKETPLLAKLIGKVKIPFSVKEKIDRAIDEHSNIRDEASLRLFEIVEAIRRIRSDIEKVLEGYFHAPETKKFIQEKNITMKDDRYVIPIKHSFKGKIPGIVHAESGSGETLFLEPFSITQKNNEIRLFYKEKEKEIRKILVSLTREVGKNAQGLNIVQDTLAHMDILLAKYRFMNEYECTIPELEKDRMIMIKEARHPLIKGEIVPIDFEIEGPKTGVVITGPNTGGKTVTLKTIGLFVLLAQSGLPVPAREMKTFLFDSLYADIGDEQSIEQSLSTFSGHIKNIKQIVDRAGKRTLVLIDELGAGTDPIEGGAIGTAILDFLMRNGILSIVTTHFSSVKVYALNSDEIEVASVEFDPETCKPTFRLVMGIPGRSNALEIARHLGLEKAVLDKTKEFISERDRSVDGIFKKLSDMELRLNRKREKIERQEERLNKLTKEYTGKLKNLEEKERFIRTDYEKELIFLLEDYRKRIEKNVQEIKEKRASKESIKAARDELSKVEEDFKDYEKLQRITGGESDETGGEDLRIGDRVVVDHEYGEKIRGKVTKIVDDEVTVQAGIFQLTVKKEHISPYKGETENLKDSWDYEPEDMESKAVNACDIRGKRFDEAMVEVVRFLDNAVLQNIGTVSIIHGLGTGALREGVWETLKRYKYVDNFEYARPEQGGFGCTIVNLKR